MSLTTDPNHPELTRGVDQKPSRQYSAHLFLQKLFHPRKRPFPPAFSRHQQPRDHRVPRSGLMMTLRLQPGQLAHSRVRGGMLDPGGRFSPLRLLPSGPLKPEQGRERIGRCFGAARMLVGTHRAAYPGGAQGRSQGL